MVSVDGVAKTRAEFMDAYGTTYKASVLPLVGNESVEWNRTDLKALGWLIQATY